MLLEAYRSTEELPSVSATTSANSNVVVMPSDTEELVTPPTSNATADAAFILPVPSPQDSTDIPSTSMFDSPPISDVTATEDNPPPTSVPQPTSAQPPATPIPEKKRSARVPSSKVKSKTPKKVAWTTISDDADWKVNITNTINKLDKRLCDISLNVESKIISSLTEFVNKLLQPLIADNKNSKQTIEDLKSDIVTEKQLWSERYEKLKTGQLDMEARLKSECELSIKTHQEELKDDYVALQNTCTIQAKALSDLREECAKSTEDLKKEIDDLKRHQGVCEHSRDFVTNATLKEEFDRTNRSILMLHAEVLSRSPSSSHIPTSSQPVTQNSVPAQHPSITQRQPTAANRVNQPLPPRQPQQQHCCCCCL